MKAEWTPLWVRPATQRNLHEAAQIVDKLRYARVQVYRSTDTSIRGTRTVRVYVLKGQTAAARKVCGLLPVGGFQIG